MNQLKKTLSPLAFLIIAVACHDDISRYELVDDSPIIMDLENESMRASTKKQFALYSGEFVTVGSSGKIGRTIYFKQVGSKHLEADFAFGKSLDGTNDISYYIDQKRPSNDVALSTSTNAIRRAMNTWDDVRCSSLGIFQIPSTSKITTGYVSALMGFGGSLDYTADIVHAGWLPGEFFDGMAAEGSSYILAITFTIIATDSNGNPTDADNNGKLDVAFREIYYNDSFTWNDHGDFDIETIALHESGHGLSQAHFGKAFLQQGSGQLHFSPLAVMNASYSRIQTKLSGTDNAGHCSIWASWNN